MVSDLDEFKKNWSIFSEGSLSQLKDWNNVITLVLACLAPLSDADKASKRAMNIIIWLPTRLRIDPTVGIVSYPFGPVELTV